ncbi:MAG: Eco57I restriction-modification methylase domain-containing protein, partial [Promethearchaeota archaeon]
MKIDTLLKEIYDVARLSKNETELSQSFFEKLRRFLKDQKINVSIRKEEKSLSGRSDARIGRIFFELKAPGVLKSKKERINAYNQIIGYMSDFVRDKNQTPMGIISDGEVIREVLYDEDTDSFHPIDKFGNVIDESEPFIAINDAELVLFRMISGTSYRKLSSDNLLEDFGHRSSICKASVSALWDALSTTIDVNKRIQIFFEQWKMLFSHSINKILPSSTDRKRLKTLEAYGLESVSITTESDAAKFLFCVQTYYALILKLLAVTVLNDRNLAPFDIYKEFEINSILSLEKFHKSFFDLGLNILEEDVFSWFEHLQLPDIKGFLKQLSARVFEYDVSNISHDVLKRVYQQLIPPALRKALGEFYTKDWAAQLLLDAVGYTGKGRILDPACGSGTFLIQAIIRLRQSPLNRTLPPKELLNKIISNVVGFDINPIAVMTSRLNYFLSVADLIESSKNYPSIPVFLCDSVVTPKIIGQLLTDPVRRIKTALSEFTVPSYRARQLLRLISKNLDKDWSKFRVLVEKELGNEYLEKFETVIRNLFEQLIKYEEEGINRIWCSFIENFFAPILQQPFDFVVGNPPWVAPERIAKDYRDDVIANVKNQGFLEGFRMKFQKTRATFPSAEKQFVACLPFFGMTLERYLKQGGKCAFLVTSSMLKSLNAGGFRKKIQNFRIEKIVDLTLETKIHEGALCWAFIPVFVKESANTNQ